MAEQAVQWTDSQRRAIEARGGDLLVAASAGTGKTAVLVERCIQLATDAAAPIDLDRMLVVTFTDAAAAEMRNRVSEALRRRIEADPANARLRRQSLLLDRASISTLHSFALRTVQEQFFRLGLDPNLKVMDPDEARLLRHETLDEVFESLYVDESESGRRFARLVERYGRNGDDAPVRRVVLDLWEFMRSLPWPDFWRERVIASYPESAATPFDQLPTWYAPFIAAIREDLLRIKSDLEAAAQWAFDTDPSILTYEGYFQRIADWLEGLRGTLDANGFEAFRAMASAAKYPKLYTNKEVAADLMAELRGRNDAIRERFNKTIVKGWCALSGEQWVATLAATRDGVEALFALAARFDEAFARAKHERGEVDFGDLERFCFQLLCDPACENRGQAPAKKRTEPVPDFHPPSHVGGYVPSDVARTEIRDRFEVILVDEYQDINPLQDAIIRLCSREGDPERPPNLFMVGDVKQSIYRFRLAEPKLFLQKLQAFRPDAAAGGSLRIDLSENHRSRAALLDAINQLCRRIMTPEVGGISYDAAAELRGGFDYPKDAPRDVPPPTAGTPIEVHLFDRSREVTPATESSDSSDRSDESDRSDKSDAFDKSAAPPPTELEDIEMEALWVANRIREMVETGEFSIWDRRDNRYRAVAFRDIAILLQTAVYKADLFVRVLRARGVPAYTDALGGRFQASEIRDLFALLELLDNPCQDIPLAAVLRSPLAGLSEDDLARIRTHRRDDVFFAAVTAYRDNGADADLRKRLAGFFDRLERWRTLARRGPLAQALWTVYDETGYLDYVTAMDDGAQRRANLIGLYDRARQFDEFRRRGLGRFLQFIRQLQETEGELTSPPAVSEADDVVRVMSIHKSKGLEFPVVFIPDVGKAFNFQNAQGDVVVDRDFGVALRAVEPERAIKYPTAAHLVAARRVRHEILAEQLRLLYVALTRAREKLILCGSVYLEQAMNQWRAEARRADTSGAALNSATIASAVSFSDWIGPALVHMGCLMEEWDRLPTSPTCERTEGRQVTNLPHAFAVHYHRAEEMGRVQLTLHPRLADGDVLRKIAAMQPVSPPPHDRPAVAQIMERLSWKYPVLQLTEIRGKLSVSEIKRRFDAGRERDESQRDAFLPPMAKRPDFLTIQADGQVPLTAAEIGTATHTVLRHFDLSAAVAESSIRREIERITAEGKISRTEAQSVDATAIARFFHSAWGEEMRRSPDRTRRELPFSLAVPASEIARLDSRFAKSEGSDESDRSDWSDALWENEWVLVQGIIDCLIERPEGFVVLDFKTDQVENDAVSARAARYRPQLAFYARAVETIFRRPVIERVLYFLHGGVAV